MAKNVLLTPQLRCDISVVGPKTKTKKTLGWGRSDADDVYDDRNHMRGEKETSAEASNYTLQTKASKLPCSVVHTR